METHHLWDKKTFASMGLSVVLSSGLAVGVHDAKPVPHHHTTSAIASESHTSLLSASSGREGR